MTFRGLLWVLAWTLSVPLVRAQSTDSTDQATLQNRLTASTAEVEKLRREDNELQQNVSRLQAQLAATRSANEATSDSSPPAHETVFLRSPARPAATPWPVLLATAAVMLLVGFMAGWKSLDRRIRRKYGGLRIY